MISNVKHYYTIQTLNFTVFECVCVWGGGGGGWGGGEEGGVNFSIQDN